MKPQQPDGKLRTTSDKAKPFARMGRKANGSQTRYSTIPTSKTAEPPDNILKTGRFGMRKGVVVLFLCGALLSAVPGLSTPAHAALINNGNGLIYDTVLNITWYDHTYMGPQGDGATWSQAMSWAAGLKRGRGNRLDPPHDPTRQRFHLH